MSITVLNQKNFSSTTAAVDEAAVKPLPNSRKIYAQGSRPDIQVPMREISQTDTMTNEGAEKNPPIWVYDTSGPYTDPAAKIDIRSGLPALREKWIEARGDSEIMQGLSSSYGRARLQDPKLADMRFNLQRQPRRSKAGMNVTQMHYARQGIITPEMEFIAIRENQRYEAFNAENHDLLTQQHAGQHFGAIPALLNMRKQRIGLFPGKITFEVIHDFSFHVLTGHF